MKTLSTLLLLLCFFFFNSNSQLSGVGMPQLDQNDRNLPLTLEINQKDPLEYCRIKANYRALYLCKNHSSLMHGITRQTKYSERYLLEGIIDADLDSNYIVIVDKQSFILVRDNYILPAMQLKNVVPILVRIKSRPLYVFTAMISLSTTSFEQTEGLISKADEFKSFEIQTYLNGVNPNIRTIRFPIEKFDFQLSEDSFIDALLIDDFFYGKEHFVVALKGGWIYVFRTVFQDSEIESSQAIKLEKGSEIRSIVANDLFLVILIENQEDKSLKIMTYRINTHSGPIFQHQCDISLERKLDANFSYPELRLKRRDNTFLLLINFPNEEILTYHFQSSSLGNLVKTCPIRASIVSNYQKQYSYSLDHVSNHYMDGVTEQGILFSPIDPQSKSSLFVRYCFPNTFWNDTSGCTPCINGYSSGGAQPECSPCPLDKNNTIIANYNPMMEVCQTECINKERFGPSCLPCSEYMITMNATLPEGSHWGIDQKGQCGFICEQGTADKMSGSCLSENEAMIQLDHCMQVTDCFNCSFTSGCGWCGGSCKQFSQCNNGEVKSFFRTNFLIPALNCNNQLDMCGNREYTGLEGTIGFSVKSIQKNQICQWDVRPEKSDIYQVDLSIHAKGLVELSEPITLHIEFCLTRGSCYVLPTVLDREVINLSFNATNFLFVFWTDRTVIASAMNLTINYTLNSFSVELLNEILYPLKWIISMLSLCLISSCLILSLQKLQAHVRRRRLLLELQDIDQYNHSDVEMANLNVDELLDNNRIINISIYDPRVSNEFQQTECSICLDEFKTEEPLAKVVACKHIFHIKCFESWARSVEQPTIKCPICNHEII